MKQTWQLVTSKWRPFWGAVGLLKFMWQWGETIAISFLGGLLKNDCIVTLKNSEQRWFCNLDVSKFTKALQNCYRKFWLKATFQLFLQHWPLKCSGSKWKATYSGRKLVSGSQQLLLAKASELIWHKINLHWADSDSRQLPWKWCAYTEVAHCWTKERLTKE